MFADQTCVANVQKITNVVDNILIGINDTATTLELKTAFGLPNVTYDDDFAYTISYGVDAWQSKNWDPAVNDPSFDIFCSNITTDSLIWPATEGLPTTVQDLLTKGGYGAEVATLTVPFLNWIGWLGDYTVDSCQGDQDACYSTHIPDFYAQDSLDDDWRSWPYQVGPHFLFFPTLC